MSNILLTRKSTPLALLSSMALATLAHSAGAAVIVDFNQAKPTTDVIVSPNPTGTEVSSLNWVWDSFNKRPQAQIFTAPEGGTGFYEVDRLTMKLNSAPTTNWANPSGFTLTFYEIANRTSNPFGTEIISFNGTIQANTTVQATYFTFNLDAPVTLEGGKYYSYVLEWDEPVTGQRLFLEYNGYDVNLGRIWYTPADNDVWSAINQTYVFYLQGTEAIPEGETLALLPIGALAIGLIARRRRKLAVGV